MYNYEQRYRQELNPFLFQQTDYTTMLFNLVSRLTRLLCDHTHDYNGPQQNLLSVCWVLCCSLNGSQCVVCHEKETCDQQQSKNHSQQSVFHFIRPSRFGRSVTRSAQPPAHSSWQIHSNQQQVNYAIRAATPAQHL